jgi:predicted nucleic acid-binding protein
MEESSRIFADSNYFVALFNPGDSLHRNALSIAKKLDAEKCSLVISNFVFLEAVTVIAQKRGRDIAVEMGKYFLNDNGSMEVIHIDEELQEYSWEIFQRENSKNISFVDCSIIAAMKSENISELLTFDLKDFKSFQKRYRFNLFNI